MNARALALAALLRWRQGREFADAILQQSLAGSDLAPADRAFATELFYGVLRNLTLLDFWIAQLRSGGLDDSSRDLLRLGFYQLFCLATAGHAAVFETVELSGGRNRALINAILRTALRQKEQLERAAETAPIPILYSHPEFLFERWRRAFGEEAAVELCRWDNRPAPNYARINRLRTTPEDFVAAHPGTELSSAKTNFVRLAGVPADALARGDCYIQDPSTGLACELLGPQPNETVLDACAAPGGKSGYLAEMMANTGSLVACDAASLRATTLRENLARLGANNARVLQHRWSAGALPPELAAMTFDRILIDAPCSNTGVMRRRVDVRWRLRADDFVRMPEQQLAIVRAVIPLLKSGGVLVYSTCSLEAEENEQLVARVLEEFPVLQLESQTAVLPFRDGFDGAFAARLRARA